MQKSLLTSAVLACACVPGIAMAEATVTNPATTNSTATAHVDVAVVIPAVLYLRVGTAGALNTNNATIDKLTFAVPASSIGSNVPVAAGATDGDLGNGALTVRVYSNVGTGVKLESSVKGGLKSSNPAITATIPWSQINVAAAALSATTTGFTNAAITHPPFNTAAGGGTTATPTQLAAVNQLVMYEGMWTYTYLNASMLPGGTYGDTDANNGRVTYTATQL